ncbi:MAG: hypothetical protein ACM3YE_03460 [Bacteroidota bacterium]
MKKLKLLGFILLAGIIIGCSGKMPIPIEGIYPLKTKTLTIFDLYSQEYRFTYNVAEVVEAKPEKVTIGFDLQRLNDYRFGSFKLGNNNQQTWFVMGKDDQGYWSEFYIDQNNDLKIKESEKIKSFQSGQDRVKGLDRSQSLTLIPVRIRVSYKGLAGEIQKNLYLFILTTVLSKNKASDLLVEAITASFLDGEIQVASGEIKKRINFRLIDANGNGCFNDYGSDLIFFDLNSNDYYQQNESHKLVEFFNLQTITGEEKQLRIIVPPFPAKLAVIEADQDYDLLELEAKSDQGEDDEAEDSVPENKAEPAPANSKQ